MLQNSKIKYSLELVDVRVRDVPVAPTSKSYLGVSISIEPRVFYQITAVQVYNYSTPHNDLMVSFNIDGSEPIAVNSTGRYFTACVFRLESADAGPSDLYFFGSWGGSTRESLRIAVLSVPF